MALKVDVMNPQDGGLKPGSVLIRTQGTRDAHLRFANSLNSMLESFMADKTLETLFHDTLRDIYYAERKILKSLPKMARAANAPDLKAAFEKHRDQTEGQIERLQQVFEIIGKPARGKTCDAIEGILAEGDEIAEEYKDSPALDAGLLAAAQAVEHYEITRYGTLKRWAEVLGLEEAVRLLDETLQEESQTDVDLTAIADAAVNAEALQPAG